jgi:hypothetical protein
VPNAGTLVSRRNFTEMEHSQNMIATILAAASIALIAIILVLGLYAATG